jgi:hypothetical protein
MHILRHIYEETWLHMIQDIKWKQSSYWTMKKMQPFTSLACSQAQSQSHTMNACICPVQKQWLCRCLIEKELTDLPRCRVRTNITRAGVNVGTPHNCSWRQRFTGVDNGLWLHFAVSYHASFIRLQKQLKTTNMQPRKHRLELTTWGI